MNWARSMGEALLLIGGPAVMDWEGLTDETLLQIEEDSAVMDWKELMDEDSAGMD